MQPQLFGGGAERVAWIARRLDGQLVVCRTGTQHVQYAVCPPEEHYQGLLCSQGNRQ